MFSLHWLLKRLKNLVLSWWSFCIFSDIDENKEAEEKLQTGNDIVQPLPVNSLQKVYSVSLSVPSDVLQSILDYNSRYRHHLKLISHEAVGSFDPWQIAERYMNCLCVWKWKTEIWNLTFWTFSFWFFCPPFPLVFQSNWQKKPCVTWQQSCRMFVRTMQKLYSRQSFWSQCSEFFPTCPINVSLSLTIWEFLHWISIKDSS